jgi:hypothetical protein
MLFDNAASIKYSPNAAYYADTNWGRDVYLFVERARIFRQADLPAGITSKYNAALATLMVPYSGATIGANKLANQDAAFDSNVGAVKLAYGFVPALNQTITYFKPSN